MPAIPRPNILIYDCCHDELMQLIKLLDKDYAIACATDGDDCIDQASAICPDLLIVDHMAFRPTCDEIGHALKANPGTQHARILLLSDLMLGEPEDECALMGADDYICRPIQQDELILKIETLLSYTDVARYFEK